MKAAVFMCILLLMWVALKDYDFWDDGFGW